MYVLCKLPNVGDVINGVRFRKMEGVGAVSVEQVPDDVAQRFAKIPGYELLESLPGARLEPKSSEDAGEGGSTGRRRRRG